MIGERDLVTFLERLGFTVSASNGGYRVLPAPSLPVRGILATEGGWYAGDHAWLLALDHDDCYDKPQKCPIRATPSEIDGPLALGALRDAIHFLASNEGYERSNTYGYHDRPIWPPSEIPR